MNDLTRLLRDHARASAAADNQREGNAPRVPKDYITWDAAEKLDAAERVLTELGEVIAAALAALRK